MNNRMFRILNGDLSAWSFTDCVYLFQLVPEFWCKIQVLSGLAKNRAANALEVMILCPMGLGCQGDSGSGRGNILQIKKDIAGCPFGF